MEIDMETRAGLPDLVLPPHDVVIPGADNVFPSDEDDIAYNQWCNETIKNRLEEVRKANESERAGWDEARFGPVPARLERPMIRTHYPDDDFESEDVVSLDDDGNIIVLDAGDR